MRDPKALVGSQLGPWQVVRMLGAGAMGAVFEATRGDERAALKVVLTGYGASEAERQRFVREAKAVSRVRSDYVCGGLGYGEDEGLQWLALEFVAGRDLAEVLQLRGKLSVEEAIDYTRQLLLGLTHAHAAGVVHRDLKPANAILTAEGRVKLVDFGLARRDDESMLLTAEGAIMGTPYYMSPEQVEGRVVDARTDLYSLGHVVFHFLVGSPAYTGRNAGQILSAHLSRTIPSVQRLRPDAPKGLDRYLRKLTAVDLERRFASSQEALDAFDELLARAERGGGASALEDEPPPPRGGGGFGVFSETLPVTSSPLTSSPLTNSAGGADPARRAASGPLAETAAPGAETLNEPSPHERAGQATYVGAASRPPTGPPPPAPLPVALALLAALLAGGAGFLLPPLAGLSTLPRRGGIAALATILAYVIAQRWIQQRNATALRVHNLSVGNLRQKDLKVGVSAARFSDEQQAKRLERGGDYAAAARQQLELGEHNEAARLFEQAGQLSEAARIRADQGQPFAAADLLLEARDPLGAARVLAEHAAELEAKRKHEQRPRSLARLDQQLAKVVERASALFRDEGQLREAAKLLARVGRHRDAADLFLEAGAREEASQELIKAGDEQRAAELYERAGDVVAAARLQAPELLRAGDKAGAARAYEQVGDLPRAARYYEESGQLDRAADLLERLGEAVRAAELYERLGKHQRAAELFEGKGDHFRAARALEQAGRPSDALARYHQVPAGHPDWGQAMRRIARLEDAGTELPPPPAPRAPAPSAGPASAAAEEVFDPGATYSPEAETEIASRSALAAETQGPPPLDPGAATLWNQAEPAQTRAAASSSPSAPAPLPDAGGATLWDQGPPPAATRGSLAETEVEPDATLVPGGADATLVPGGPDATHVPAAQAAGVSAGAADETYVPPGAADAAGAPASAAAETYVPPAAAGAAGAPASAAAETYVPPGAADAAGAPASAAAETYVPAGSADETYVPAGSAEATYVEASPTPPPQRPRGGPPSRRPRGPARPQPGAQPTRRRPPPYDPRRWIDQVVDRYRVRGLLGSGAFADVFRAEHVHLERPVALKILRPELAARADVVERFLAEAKVVSRIHHRGVVEVYDFGQTKGVPFMALELVEGTNLRDRVQPGGLPLPEVRSLGRDLCLALGAAHKAGVIHRDLKPENILVDREGRAHVLDFGMARVFWGTTRDEGAGFLGTPRYASPEAADEGDVAAPADQYALGLILYELATGQLPFSSSSTVGWLHHHRSTRPRPPRELRPDLPHDLEEALLVALAKAPHERHSDLSAFAAALG